MTMLEMALIAAGLSMDIFAWTACRSTLFSNIGRTVQFYRSFRDMGSRFHILRLLCGKAAQNNETFEFFGRFFKIGCGGNLLCAGHSDAVTCHGQRAD